MHRRLPTWARDAILGPVELDRLVTAFVGAFFGAAGWLVVGLYIQRRQAERQARSAGRAVYFELAVNEVNLDVALRHGSFQPLAQGTYERLLPELASWLTAEELQTIARAYMSHAGYEQVQRDALIPPPVRMALLERVTGEHRAALEALRRRAFSRGEIARLSLSPRAQGTAAGTTRAADGIGGSTIG